MSREPANQKRELNVHELSAGRQTSDLIALQGTLQGTDGTGHGHHCVPCLSTDTMMQTRCPDTNEVSGPIAQPDTELTRDRAPSSSSSPPAVQRTLAPTSPAPPDAAHRCRSQPAGSPWQPKEAFRRALALGRCGWQALATRRGGAADRAAAAADRVAGGGAACPRRPRWSALQRSRCACGRRLASIVRCFVAAGCRWPRGAADWAAAGSPAARLLRIF